MPSRQTKPDLTPRPYNMSHVSIDENAKHKIVELYLTTTLSTCDIALRFGRKDRSPIVRVLKDAGVFCQNVNERFAMQEAYRKRQVSASVAAIAP